MRVKRFNEISSTAETNELLSQIALWHLDQIPDSSVGSSIRDLLASSNYSGLVNYHVDYNQLSLYDAYHVRQVLAFFQKRVDLDIGIDREDVAKRTFVQAEILCAETNDIFRLRDEGRFYFFPRVESVLYKAQQKISQILDDVPSLESLKFTFGPGATTQVKRTQSSSRRKLGEVIACSEDLIPLLPEVLSEMPLLARLSPDVEVAKVDVELHPSILHFVPKNAKTDRSIGVEPSLNTMFQLGIGSYISSRLKRFGVDIRDQTLNQRLAHRGSLTGALATLDLSSASDLISKSLVLDLLPIDWVVFLSRARTSKMSTPWGQITLEKFSSMGNGFTFPLETLIFYSLAKATCESLGIDGPVSVYGDDIIVPVAAYLPLVEVLHSVGFLVNRDKSFYSGPFRESCGKDYFLGTLIRPVYVKDRLSAADLFILHNFYVRRDMPDAAALLLPSIHEPLRIYGPDGYGDGHLLGDWRPIPHNRKIGWCGWTFETYCLKGRVDFTPSKGDYVYPCYSVYASPSCEGLPGYPVAPLLKLMQSYGLRYSGPRDSVPVTRYSKGVLGASVPGSQGYKSIKIYTLLDS